MRPLRLPTIGVGDLVERVVTARGLDVELAQPDVDRTARDRRVLAADRRLDLAERDARTTHALEVDGDADLGLRQREHLGAAHARHRLDLVAQRAAELVELAIARVRADERDLHDVDQARTRAPHLEVRDVRRQVRADPVHLAHDLVVLLVRVLVPLELDLDDADAVERAAVHALDVVELADRVLDRVDDQALDVRRVGAGVGDDDDRHRRVELGILRARDVVQRADADGDQQPEQQQRELPAPDGECPEPHGSAPVAARLRGPRGRR